MRRRHQKEKQAHFCLLVNREATNYSSRAVDRLTRAIRKAGGHYSVFEPRSAMDLLQISQRVCGLRRWKGNVPHQFTHRGKVSGLIACGGDGTFNLVARAALKADLPVGALPLGEYNNIVQSLYGSTDVETAIARILNRDYRLIDFATAADQPFFGSAGIGLIPKLARKLDGRKRPRFGFSWGQLGSKAAAEVDSKKLIIKIDAFRFDVSPVVLNINLLPYSLGLPFSPASILDDGRAEVILNFGVDKKSLSTFIGQVYKKKYVYGSEVRLFRGKRIDIQPARGRTLYLDGELIKLPYDLIEIEVSDKKLKAFC